MYHVKQSSSLDIATKSKKMLDLLLSSSVLLLF